MAVTIEATEHEQDVRCTCNCGKTGMMKFSTIGLMPPDGWYVSVFHSTFRRVIEQVVACSLECTKRTQILRAKREQEDHDGTARRVQVFGPGALGG